MKKLYFLFVFLVIAQLTFGQTTVTIYAGGSLPHTDSITGYVSKSGTSAYTRGKDTIYATSFGTFINQKGYAVFNLASIPSTAIISSVKLGYNILNFTGGGGGPTFWRTYGFAGDLSLVTNPAVLWADMTAGTLVNSTSYGAAIGNQVLASNPATVSFVAAHLGSKVSMCFTDTNQYYVIRGESGIADTSGDHAPYLQITYTDCPPLTGISRTCIGGSTTLVADTVGIWSSTDTSVATVDGFGNVYGAGDGTVIIVFEGGGCTIYDTVTVGPIAAISGPSSVCIGSSITLTDASGTGTWSSLDPGIAWVTLAGGVVTGASFGTTTITYATGTGCSATKEVTVVSTPGAISGPTTFCVGSPSALSDGTTGGTWSSSVGTVATIETTTGMVHPVSPGTTVITYSTGTGCNVTYSITVTAAPAAITPLGSTPINLCVGATTPLGETVTGGVWSAGNGNASVSSTGVVTGVSAGAVTISYSIGSCIVTREINVTGPLAITPHSPTICTGTTITLSDATSGGVWSSTVPSVASVDASGIVTGGTPGTAVILYTFGGCSAPDTVTVTAAASPISPASSTVCVGSTITLTDAAGGGSWTSSNPSVASVTASGGIVTGATPGTVTITYGIGACVATATVTVNTGPAAITPATTTTICSGGTVALADGTPGGVWSTLSTGIATVSATGVVTGLGIGAATISYTVGGCSVTKIVNITAGPGPISPNPASVCIGGTTTLTNPATGGVWSSGNPFIATVTSGGIVSGVALGTINISYSLGTCTVTTPLTVSNPPAAIVVTGASTICSGSTTNVTDATAGGVWSSGSPTIATVSTIGLVTGLSAGTAVISYSVGSCFVTTSIIITPGPAPISPATTSVCTGLSTTLTESVPGGAWSSSNAAIATISTTGVVTGLTSGTVTISYILGSCLTISTVNVTLSASAGVITGPSTECVGSSTIVLVDTNSGGAWTSSNPSVASVSPGGVVTGVSGGTATITYTISNSCGTSRATHPVTINISPSAGTISGPSLLCAGTFVTLTDAVAGGTWISSNASASINPTTGLLTGITPGVDTITYLVVASCGTASTTKIVTIGLYLTAGVISGPTSVCQMSNITLADAAPAGSWSSFNTSIAVVTSGTGVVTGLAPGIDTIFYTVTSSCGSATAKYVITVNPLSPPVGTISGLTGVCIGGSTTLTETVSGGVWSVTNTHASISAGGVVTGASAGVDTVKYTVTGPCGSSVTTFVITVSSTPTGGTISGPGTVCAGSSITLTDPVPGGLWSSSTTNTSVGATSGIVTGVSAGTSMISYTVTNACGTAFATKTVTVNPTGTTGVLSGPDSVCIGSTIVLIPAIPGGVWTSGTGSASVSSGGVVTGVSLGSSPITYSVTTSCGTAISVKIVTVATVASVAPISGISIVCLGSGITLSDPTPGGIWSASNPSAAVVGPGIIHGISLGVDTIFYSIPGSCGTGSAFKIVSVDPVPVVAPISGTGHQCLGTLLTMTDVTPGGVWTSSSPSIASVGLSTGVALGVSLGIATITYTVTNIFGCPTSVTIPDTVLSMPALAAITGPTDVCIGATVTLANTTPYGYWVTANTAIATVVASTGEVTGVSAGTVTISYTVTNICGTATVIRTETVRPLPVVAAITGTPNECVGTTTTLADATTGGVWSSGDTTIATVNATTGVVTGVAPGVVIIYYKFTGAYGCSNTVSISNTVSALPVIAPITGILHECVGSATVLSDATPGGVWSSASTAIATVDGAGVVSGVSGGTVTISYSVTAGGCTGAATAIDSVYAIPVAAPIGGGTHACIGGNTTLTNAVPLGTWSSGDVTIATINAATGVVTGVSAGTVVISYTVANGCGPGITDTITITVYPSPSPGTITAAFTVVCAGSTVNLSDPVTGGHWSSTNNTIATVGSSSGVVSALAVGIDTILYTVTNSNGCSASAMIAITVGGAIPTSGIMPAGTASICHGHPVLLHITGSTGSTYQWLRNGTAIPGATDTAYMASASGSYAVIISNGTCSMTLTSTNVIISTNPNITLNPPNMLYTGSYHSYQWLKDDVIVPGATSGIFYGTGPGVYKVIVVDAGGCADTSVGYIIRSGGGVNVPHVYGADDIKIYPNPANGIVHIDAPVNVNVTLLGMDGKVLIDQKNAANIDVSGLANGIYMIMVYDENNLLLKTAKFARIE